MQVTQSLFIQPLLHLKQSITNKIYCIISMSRFCLSFCKSLFCGLFQNFPCFAIFKSFLFWIQLSKQTSFFFCWCLFVSSFPMSFGYLVWWLTHFSIHDTLPSDVIKKCCPDVLLGTDAILIIRICGSLKLWILDYKQNYDFSNFIS